MIFSSFTEDFVSPKLERFNTANTHPKIMANKTASVKYPIPEISPVAMARKIMEISLAVPGAERNRTREKAPATAIPAPILPFTIMITTATIAGKVKSVIRKLFVVRFLYEYVAARNAPISRDMHRTIKNF